MAAVVLAAMSVGLGARAAPRVATPPAPAAAPSTISDTLTGQVRKDYDTARVLLADGDFGGALVKFTAAYDASKDGRLLWNIAACEKTLRHYARAVALLRRYAEAPTTNANDKHDAAERCRCS